MGSLLQVVICFKVQAASPLAHGSPQDQVMTAIMVAEFSLESH
jgi:hypothetical protein